MSRFSNLEPGFDAAVSVDLTGLPSQCQKSAGSEASASRTRQGMRVVGKAPEQEALNLSEIRRIGRLFKSAKEKCGTKVLSSVEAELANNLCMALLTADLVFADKLMKKLGILPVNMQSVLGAVVDYMTAAGISASFEIEDDGQQNLGCLQLYPGAALLMLSTRYSAKPCAAQTMLLPLAVPVGADTYVGGSVPAEPKDIALNIRRLATALRA